MSEHFCQVDACLSSARLRDHLLAGGQGCWLVEGPGPLEVRGEARVGRLLIAHGAGAGQDSAFMLRLRDALAGAGVQTLAIEFGYMQQMRRTARRRPP